MRVLDTNNVWVPVTHEVLWRVAQRDALLMGEVGPNPYRDDTPTAYENRHVTFCICPSDDEPVYECEVIAHYFEWSRQNGGGGR